MHNNSSGYSCHTKQQPKYLIVSNGDTMQNDFNKTIDLQEIISA